MPQPSGCPLTRRTTGLIALGREVKRPLNDTEHAAHPTDHRLSGIYGTILFEDLGAADDGHAAPAQRHRVRRRRGRSLTLRIRNLRPVALLADGRARSAGPTAASTSRSSGTASGRRVATTEAAGRSAVVPEVSGMAYRTGEHTFELDPADPLGEGFVLR